MAERIDMVVVFLSIMVVAGLLLMIGFGFNSYRLLWASLIGFILSLIVFLLTLMVG